MSGRQGSGQDLHAGPPRSGVPSLVEPHPLPRTQQPEPRAVQGGASNASSVPSSSSTRAGAGARVERRDGGLHARATSLQPQRGATSDVRGPTPSAIASARSSGRRRRAAGSVRRPRRPRAPRRRGAGAATRAERGPERLEVRGDHGRRADAALVGDERHARRGGRGAAPTTSSSGRSAGRSAQTAASRRSGSRRCISAAACTRVPLRSLVPSGITSAPRSGIAAGQHVVVGHHQHPRDHGRTPARRRRCPRRRRRPGRGGVVAERRQPRLRDGRRLDRHQHGVPDGARSPAELIATILPGAARRRHDVRARELPMRHAVRGYPVDGRAPRTTRTRRGTGGEPTQAAPAQGLGVRLLRRDPRAAAAAADQATVEAAGRTSRRPAAACSRSTTSRTSTR